MKPKLYVCLYITSFVAIVLLPQLVVAENRSAEELRQLGRRAFFEERYTEAEQYLRQSLAVLDTREDKSRTDVAVTRDDLAWLLVAKGNYAEAEQLLDSGLRLLQKDSERCQAEGIILSHLGTVYEKTGRYAKAERALKGAVQRSERCDPLYVEVALNNLGILYGKIGKLKAAAAALERAIASVEKRPIVGESKLILAYVATNLAAVQHTRGNVSVAEQLLLRAKDLLEGEVEGTYEAMSMSLLSLTLEAQASLHYRQGKFAEAESEFERARDFEIRRGNNLSRISELSFQLAEVLTAKGDYQKAAVLYQQALQDGARDTATTATVLERFSTVLRTLKADRQAEEMEFRAKKIRAALAYTSRVK